MNLLSAGAGACHARD